MDAVVVVAFVVGFAVGAVVAFAAVAVLASAVDGEERGGDS